jgi:uncharacterized membrane protein
MRKDWGKLGAGFGFVGIIVALMGIIALINVDQSTRYFLISCDLILAVFIYFKYFSEQDSVLTRSPLCKVNEVRIICKLVFFTIITKHYVTILDEFPL